MNAVDGGDDSLRDHTENVALIPFLQASHEVVAAATSSSNKKSSHLSTIRSIVMKVLSEPNLFCGYNQIHAILRDFLATGTATTSGEGEKLSRSLDLFSYGTYQDYTANPCLYLDLNAAQLVKLRQLSALTVVQNFCLQGFSSSSSSSSCCQGAAQIPYQAFCAALHLDDTTSASSSAAAWNQVEEILVSCLYQGVIYGKLCQQSRSLHLSPRYAMRPRDVSTPAQLDALLIQVQALQARVLSASANLSAQNLSATRSLEEAGNFWHQAEERQKKNENSSMMRWGPDAVFGDAGGNRRQKRGRADLAAVARFQS